MLTVYHRTDTKLGFMYFKPVLNDDGSIIQEYHNFYKVFENKYQVKSYLHQIAMDILKCNVQRFNDYVRLHYKSETHLTSAAVNNLSRINEWIHKPDSKGNEKKFSTIKAKILEFKAFFVEILKSTDDTNPIKADLVALFKAITNECTSTENEAA